MSRGPSYCGMYNFKQLLLPISRVGVHRLQHLCSALGVAENLQLCLVAFQQLLLLLVQSATVAAATCSNVR